MRSSSTIDTERQDINTSDTSARPFDFSFDPDPPTNTTLHTACPYTTIGADITIAHSGARIPDFELSENAIPSLTAFADKHLQKFERKKYMRCNKRDDSSDNNLLTGDQVIGDLLKQNMILPPIAIDPHGRWGPITENFLNLLDRELNYTFPSHRPNATTMFMKSTRAPCPIGILRTADKLWKLSKTRQFFGRSYTAPTPSIYTIQQMGLGITKAFAVHIRNATKKSFTRSHGTDNTPGNSLHTGPDGPLSSSFWKFYLFAMSFTCVLPFSVEFPDLSSGRRATSTSDF